MKIAVVVLIILSLSACSTIQMSDNFKDVPMKDMECSIPANADPFITSIFCKKLGVIWRNPKTSDESRVVFVLRNYLSNTEFIGQHAWSGGGAANPSGMAGLSDAKFEGDVLYLIVTSRRRMVIKKQPIKEGGIIEGKFVENILGEEHQWSANVKIID